MRSIRIFYDNTNGYKNIFFFFFEIKEETNNTIGCVIFSSMAYQLLYYDVGY
jgi:hypothetical protein